MKILTTLAVVAALCVVGYYVVPGAGRIVDETLDDLSDEELKENWAYYWDQGVQDLQVRLDAEKQTHVELRVRVEKLRRAVDEKKDVNAKAQALLESFAATLKASAGGQQVAILGVTYDSTEAARDQLVRLVRESQRETKRVDTMLEQHNQQVAFAREHANLVDQLRIRIEELEFQKEELLSELAISDMRKHLRVLGNLGNELTDAPDVSRLSRVKAVIDDELLTREMRERIESRDDEVARQNLSLFEMLELQDEQQGDAAVEAQVEALLGG